MIIVQFSAVDKKNNSQSLFSSSINNNYQFKQSKYLIQNNLEEDDIPSDSEYNNSKNQNLKNLSSGLKIIDKKHNDKNQPLDKKHENLTALLFNIPSLQKNETVLYELISDDEQSQRYNIPLAPRINPQYSQNVEQINQNTEIKIDSREFTKYETFNSKSYKSSISVSEVQPINLNN